MEFLEIKFPVCKAFDIYLFLIQNKKFAFVSIMLDDYINLCIALQILQIQKIVCLSKRVGKVVIT